MKKPTIAILSFLLGAGLMITTPISAAVNNTVEAVFAKFNFVVNGEQKELEADPLVYQGTTYLPVRVVANMLGYDVTYKADSRTIELNSSFPQNNVPQMPQMQQNYHKQENIFNGDDNINMIKEFVLYNDFFKAAREYGGFQIDVVNSKTRLIFDNQIFFIEKNIDFYIDPNTGIDYFSVDFISQILPQNTVNSLQKYEINIETGEIIKK